jgi:hypothetical protein
VAARIYINTPQQSTSTVLGRLDRDRNMANGKQVIKVIRQIEVNAPICTTKKFIDREQRERI